MKNIFLQLKNVYQSFPMKKGNPLQASHNINLEIEDGSLTTVIGESGCGKSTLGKICLGTLRPTLGEVLIDGINVAAPSFKWNNKLRSSIQVVHQDSYASLNPVKTVYQTLSAPLIRHKLTAGKNETTQRIKKLLESVELESTDAFINKHPFQLSGGQRQRVSIARATILHPRLIVADEPVSAVDASSRLSILNLMKNLNKKSNVAFLYITHDLATARFFAPQGKIVVMYLGRVVETGIIEDCITKPMHPYLQALLKAIPPSDPLKAKNPSNLPLTSFEMPKATNPPSGCVFHPRCPYAKEKCITSIPQLTPLADGRRQVACHFN